MATAKASTSTTAGASKSISGKAHGAKPTDTQKVSTQRWYPQLDGLPGVHPEVANAIRIILDQQYQGQEQQSDIKSSLKAVSDTVASGGSGSGNSGAGGAPASESAIPDSAKATGIHGIRINAPTDPATLQNGFTIRYSTESGQFEFGM